MIKAGATTVGFADTVGINMPPEFGELVAYVKENTPGADDIVLTIHCHNDLGVATANTISVHNYSTFFCVRLINKQKLTALKIFYDRGDRII